MAFVTITDTDGDGKMEEKLDLPGVHLSDADGANADLIAKLEGAAKGSHALDREVGIAVGTLFLDGDGKLYLVDPEDGGRVYGGNDDETIITRKVTTSVDAALALIEKHRLPWMGPISLIFAGSGMAHLEHKDPCGQGMQAFGNTPALALCIAFLSALSMTPQVVGESSREAK